MRRLKRIILGIAVVLIIAAAGVLFLYNTNVKESKRWLRDQVPPGIMVQGLQGRMYAASKGAGKPAVVIEPGLGSSSPEWWHIQDAVAKRTKVITYDRAGYGWSDPGQKPRSAEIINKELRDLLNKLHVQPPYILVGHDVGALYMVSFAKRFPGQVAGVVLVDPFPVNYYRFQKEIEKAVYKNYIDKRSSYKIGGFFGRTGVVRWLKIVPYMAVPAETRQLIVENYSLEKFYDAVLNEYGRGLKTTLEITGNIKSLGKIPLILIQHSPEANMKEMIFFGVPVDEAKKIESIWEDSYSAILKYSTRTKKVIAKKSPHNVHFDEPELIVRAVLDLLPAGPR